MKNKKENKIKQNFWESIFDYPSFNTRFGAIVFAIFAILAILIYWLYPLFTSTADKLTFLNLIIQGATLVLGIFAAFYALRQLVETRLINLDESGMSDLKRKHYLRAINKWKEAFYIKPEARIFCNLEEAVILHGDFEKFDLYLTVGQNRKIFDSDDTSILTVLYLEILRHLVVKNLGVAEDKLIELIDKQKSTNPLQRFGWDFSDLMNSLTYKNLNGECKVILDNLISYLKKEMSPLKKKDFESGNFATQIPS